WSRSELHTDDGCSAGYGLVEVAAHERGDGGERFACLAARGGDVDAVAGERAERRQRADAPATDRRTSLGQVADRHLGVEATDGLDEPGCRTGMEAVLVVDSELDP